MLKELSKKIKETKYTNLLGANFIGHFLLFFRLKLWNYPQRVDFNRNFSTLSNNFLDLFIFTH
jgi:hypothetical protein